MLPTFSAGEPSRRFLVNVLALALLVQCLGQGWTITSYGSAFAKSLWLDLSVNDTLAFAIDRYAFYSFVLLFAWSLYARHALGLYLLGAWLFFLTGNEWYQGGSFGAPYSPIAHAVRFTSPWALALLLCKKNERSLFLAYHILRISCALVFIAHGLEAIAHNPHFIDFIIRVVRSYGGLSLSESNARQLLYLIGVQDIFLALLVLVRPRPAVFAYMAFWGFLTALVRILYSPNYGVPLTLVRACNGAGPLVTYFLFHNLGLGRARTKATPSSHGAQLQEGSSS